MTSTTSLVTRNLKHIRATGIYSESPHASETPNLSDYRPQDSRANNCECLHAAKDFFALPLEAKTKTPNFKGYTVLLGESTDPDNRGDSHKGFDLGWGTIDANATKWNDDAGEDVWPKEAELPGFRKAALDYYVGSAGGFFDDKKTLIQPTSYADH
ncbi:hypothetical protein DENSPDRAFT_851908 [Dentipellis sp. KUC8613]|nr:hypothetical protein DENSPDRAFT_851908 [Dentipellis sp. KUC8613]